MKKILSYLLIFSVAALLAAEPLYAKKTGRGRKGDASKKSDRARNFSIGAGFGYSKPMGKMAENLQYAIPLFINMQWAPVPAVSVEPEMYTWLSSSSKVSGAEYTYTQYGLSVRYWFDRAFSGLYAGAGAALTDCNVLMSTSLGSVKSEDSYTTLVLKAGYVINLKPAVIDLGIRYDGIDMKAWGDQPVTLTVMAGYTF